MGRRTLLLLASLLLAALGTVLVFLYVHSADVRATGDQDPVRVLVAKKRIDAGTSASDASNSLSIATVTVPRSAAALHALSELSSIAKMTAVSTIYPGQQIISDAFAADAAASTVSIPKGKLAVSVQLSDPARVAGLLSLNSHVMVFATAQGSKGGTVTNVLLADVQVLAIGSQSTLTRKIQSAGGQTQTEQIPATIVTLALTADEAKKVVFASGNGELYLGLRGTGDNPPAGSSGVQAGDLFGGTS